MKINQSKKYVVTYDTGAGYRHFASTPQASKKDAWLASGIKPGEQHFCGFDTRLEKL